MKPRQRFWLSAFIAVILPLLAVQPWLAPSFSKAAGMCVWVVATVVTGIAVGFLCSKQIKDTSDIFDRFSTVAVSILVGLVVGFVIQHHLVSWIWRMIDFDIIDPRESMAGFFVACFGTAIVSGIFGSGFWRPNTK